MNNELRPPTPQAGPVQQNYLDLHNLYAQIMAVLMVLLFLYPPLLVIDVRHISRARGFLIIP